MRLLSLIGALAFVAGAQSTDGVNVSVSRFVNVPPDQADFSAIVAVTLDTTQQQVAQAFRDLGAPNPVVVNVAAGVPSYSYPPPPDTQFFYQISFTTAPSAVKDLAKKLDAFRGALPDGFAVFQYSAALNPSAAAVESARKTTLPLLIADARAKAQSLAEAAGVKLGAITGVSDYSMAYGAPAGYFLTNFISSGTFGYSSTSSGTQYTFSASVRFASQ